jgi:hypothetical protein
MGRNLWIAALKYALEEPIHVISSERRHQGTHLIYDTAERPDIRLVIIRLVLPDFRAGIVRSTSLGVKQTLFSNLRHIEVSKLGCVVFVKKNVCTLHVSVKYPQIMQSLEPSN